MSTNQSEQPLKFPNKRTVMWLVTEGIITVLGLFIGMSLTNDDGPLFLNTFIYPHYHPTGVSDAVLVNYFMLVPPMVFCILIWGLAIWHRIAWWKPLGFIVGCIGISLWWITQSNYYAFFRYRP